MKLTSNHLRDQAAATSAFGAARAALVDPQSNVPADWHGDIDDIAAIVADAVLVVRADDGLGQVRRLYGSQAFIHRMALIEADHDLTVWANRTGMHWPVRAAIGAAAEAVVAVYGRKED